MLLLVGLILSGATDAADKVMRPILLCLSLCSVGSAFLANAICGVKFKKTWGKAGLTDSNWFDVGANIVFAVLIFAAAFLK